MIVALFYHFGNVGLLKSSSVVVLPVVPQYTWKVCFRKGLLGKWGVGVEGASSLGVQGSPVHGIWTRVEVR